MFFIKQTKLAARSTTLNQALKEDGMSYFKEVRCIRCGRKLGSDKFYSACPACVKDDMNVNYTTVYNLTTSAKFPDAGISAKGIYRFKDFYPLSKDAVPVSIEEGNTPLIKLERLGERLGIGNLYAKDESKNPTFSYKDRLISVVVTKAKHDGASAVMVASTGNHGAAAAAYSAVAGLPCIIFTTSQVPDTMKILMQVYGACLVAVPKSIDRWSMMDKCAKEFGWMPVSGFESPPIGSNCYGIDGYKSIAFELFEQFGHTVPDMVIMPAAYSDGIYGTYKGMCDLKEMGYIDTLPRMVASEVFGSMEKTLQQGSESPVGVEKNWSVSFSIAGSMCTYQGLVAVRGSNGYARSSNDEESMRMQVLLASTEGLYAEAASVTSLVAAAKLAQEGCIGKDDKVVAVFTSSGLKDPSSTKACLPAVPVIEPEIEQLRSVLKDAYGVCI